MKNLISSLLQKKTRPLRRRNVVCRLINTSPMLPPVQPLKLWGIVFTSIGHFARDNACQEELSKIVLKQNGILLDNSQELRKYAMLKVDHQVEIRRHERATKCLHEAESSIRGLDSQLEVSIVSNLSPTITPLVWPTSGTIPPVQKMMRVEWLHCSTRGKSERQHLLRSRGVEVCDATVTKYILAWCCPRSSEGLYLQHGKRTKCQIQTDAIFMCQGGAPTCYEYFDEFVDHM